jgi:uncharacterized Rmd1/YagE family protein
MLRYLSRSNASAISTLRRLPVLTKKVFSTAPSKANPSEDLYPAHSLTFAVKAYYMARGIDVIRVHANLYGGNEQQFHTKSVTVTIDKERNQYISIFNYGSVVFFNVPTPQHFDHLHRIKEAAVVSPIADGLQHTEDYKIMVHDQLDKTSVIKAEHVNIRNLDSNNLVIIGTVMAQTVALDYYAVAVERLLESFMRMNMKIQESGNFNALDKKGLYKLIATNNTVITNVLSKLGIFEGSDAAWENADYFVTWEALRKDFEIDNRFRDLSLKLDIIKENTQFFLEMAHNQKSTKLEWTIIVLIAVEIAISITSHIVHYLK